MRKPDTVTKTIGVERAPQTPIRVLAVEDAPGFGGSAHSLYENISNLSRRSIEFQLLHSLPDHRYAKFQSVCSVLAFKGWARRTSVIGRMAHRSNAAILLDAFTIARAARRFGAHLIYANNGVGTNNSAIVAGRLCGLPVLAHERGIWRAGVSRIDRMLIPWLGHVIAISKAARQALLEMGVPSEKIDLIYNGIATARFGAFTDEDVAAFRRETGLPEDSVLILMPGMTIPEKGQHVLIEAARRLNLENKPYHIAFSGEPTKGQESYLRDLKVMVRDYGLERQVSFLGYRDDIDRLMAAADIIVHASVKPEPFGRVVAEGMAAGRAVIAANAGGPAEIITHEKTGLLVEPDNPEALANAVGRLTVDGALRSRLGKEGRREAVRAFDHMRVADSIEAVMRRLVRGGHGG